MQEPLVGSTSAQETQGHAQAPEIRVDGAGTSNLWTETPDNVSGTPIVVRFVLIQSSLHIAISVDQTSLLTQRINHCSEGLDESHCRKALHMRFDMSKSKWLVEIDEVHPHAATFTNLSSEKDRAGTIWVPGVSFTMLLRWNRLPTCGKVFKWPQDTSAVPFGVFRCLDDGSMEQIAQGDPVVFQRKFFILALPVVNTTKWTPKFRHDITQIRKIYSELYYTDLAKLKLRGADNNDSEAAVITYPLQSKGSMTSLKGFFTGSGKNEGLKLMIPTTVPQLTINTGMDRDGSGSGSPGNTKLTAAMRCARSPSCPTLAKGDEMLGTHYQDAAKGDGADSSPPLTPRQPKSPISQRIMSPIKKSFQHTHFLRRNTPDKPSRSSLLERSSSFVDMRPPSPTPVGKKDKEDTSKTSPVSRRFRSVSVGEPPKPATRNLRSTTVAIPAISTAVVTPGVIMTTAGAIAEQNEYREPVTPATPRARRSTPTPRCTPRKRTSFWNPFRFTAPHNHATHEDNGMSVDPEHAVTLTGNTADASNAQDDGLLNLPSISPTNTLVAHVDNNYGGHYIEPLSPPDPEEVARIESMMARLAQLPEVFVPDTEDEKGMDCSDMTDEEVYSARLGSIKNWMHYPPTQIAEEFLPSSMKHWDWRPLEVSGRDTFNLFMPRTGIKDPATF